MADDYQTEFDPEPEMNIVVKREDLSEEQQKRYDIVAQSHGCWARLKKPHVMLAFILDGCLPQFKWTLFVKAFLDENTSNTRVVVRASCTEFGAFGFDFHNPSEEDLKRLQANVKFLEGKHELINKLYFSHMHKMHFFIDLKNTNIQQAEKEKNVSLFQHKSSLFFLVPFFHLLSVVGGIWKKIRKQEK